MPDSTIREATSNDLPKLKAIIGVSFPRFFRYFATHSLTSEGKVLVYEADGNVAGFAKLIEFQIGERKYGCILWLAVHPSHRRRGVAAELVKAGTAKLKSIGAEAVYASVDWRNKASLATFDGAGFRRVGFLGLWRLFGWRVFSLYLGIWYVPGEIALMHA